MYTHEYQERREPRAPSRPVAMPEEYRELWPCMWKYLEDRALDGNIADANGWYPTMDYQMCARVVIPASSLVNSWPYYQARLIVEAHPNVKRYVSPAAPRGDALAVVFPSFCVLGSIIVEGPMDALAAAGMGYVGIGLMGNTPNEAVLDHIKEIVGVYGDCFVIPDRDAFTEGAELTAKLWTRGVKCTLKSITGGKDLAELSPSRRKRILS